MSSLFYQKTSQIIDQWKASGFLAVVYALLAEALFIGYLGFIGLFTIETLLPTFVTVRLSLTKFLFILVVLSVVLAAIGDTLDVSFRQTVSKKSPLLWIGLLWMLSILIVSLYKFPPLTIPIIVAGFFLVGFLFWNILFGEEE